MSAAGRRRAAVTLKDLAAELGVLSTHLARHVEALTHLSRCHVYRIGDGGAHLHVWFFGRPEERERPLQAGTARVPAGRDGPIHVGIDLDTTTPVKV